MKKATVLFFVLCLFSLSVVCQKTIDRHSFYLENLPADLPYSTIMFHKDSTNITRGFDDPVESISGITVVKSSGMGIYTDYFGPYPSCTPLNHHYNREDIREMADWKMLINPKL